MKRKAIGFIVMAGLVLGTLSAWGGTPPARPGAVGVLGVSIKPAQGGTATLVRVVTSRTPDYHAFRLPNPPRLVVDIKDASTLTRRFVYAAQSPYLKEIRLGRFSNQDGGTIRVVADLEGSPAFAIEAKSDGLNITFTGRDLKSLAKNSSISASRPASPTAAMIKPDALLPPHSASAPSAPVQAVAKLAAAPSVDYARTLPAVVRPRASEDVAVKANQESAVRAARILADDRSGLASDPQGFTPTATPQYTGQPISLDLKNVDLKDFFRLIHQISGLNIVVDPDVTGSVTLALNDVPWDQALDLVLKENGLGRTLEGNILRIARLSTLAAEQKQDAKLAAAKIDAAPLVTVFRPINYAKASTIAGMLKSWVGGGALTSRGSVIVDDRTNTLIISDITPQIPIIQSIINKLDTKSKQVLIRVRIVEGSTIYIHQLQSALEALWKNTSGSTGGGALTGSPSGQSGTSGPPVPTGLPVPTFGSLSGPASALGFGSIFITNTAANYAISAAISAFEERNQVRTISRPSIVTQDNVPGEVMQGAQVPVQTTINNTISVQYVNAALRMQVTPQVTEDGNVFLKIDITNNQIGSQIFGGNPSINTQSATTQVLVPDGGTVVFGGVNKSSRSNTASYIPLLGTIPVIGHLFKSSTVNNTSDELLFFVTPKILTS